MKKTLKYYSFIVVSVMVLLGFLQAKTLPQLVSAMMFYPLFTYFLLSVLPHSSHAIDIPEIKKKTKRKKSKQKKEIIDLEPEELQLETEEAKTIRDIDKRAFIKLIGSAGLSVFMLSIFTKNAQAAFFGSVPGPGTVALKDTSGNQIDPAEKQPTDGYKISQLDDSTPAYYGFTNKDGAWFIMKEDSSGNYRYSKGSSGFSTSWTGRAALTYDYFENVF